MNPESLGRCSRDDEGGILFDVYTSWSDAGPSSNYSQRWFLS